MVCEYDYGTVKNKYLLIQNERDRDILYKWRRSDNDASLSSNPEEYAWNQGEMPIKYLYDKMYFLADNYLAAILYIDFQKAQMREFQRPDKYVGQLENDPVELTKYSAFITVPIATWDCARVD